MCFYYSFIKECTNCVSIIDEDKSSQFGQSSYAVNHLWELCAEKYIGSATAQCNCYCSEMM